MLSKVNAQELTMSVYFPPNPPVCLSVCLHVSTGKPLSGFWLNLGRILAMKLEATSICNVLAMFNTTDAMTFDVGVYFHMVGLIEKYSYNVCWSNYSVECKTTAMLCESAL
jgi:hypothetical protein